MKRPAIFDDDIFRECLTTAKNCKADSRSAQAFGSCLRNNHEIIGKGYNRAIAHKHFRLERIIRQGYANHAEIEALNDALMSGREVEGSEIFVAGYFVQSGQIFFQNGFTCLKCANCLDKYGIKSINVPKPNGWKSLSIEEAFAHARKVPISGKFDYRKSIAIGDYYLDQL